ncbi:MAG: HNH endonuclease [Treponema sp.]|nr:HNH endonuclease [Treponema sp.]
MDSLTHCIGNLTPLSLRKNVQAQNYSFEKKKEAYGKKDNIATSFYTTQCVLAKDKWTPVEINEREQEIVNRLINLFKLD